MFSIYSMINYVHKLISNNADKEICSMQNKIQEILGVPVSYVMASEVVIWKSQQYKISITSEKLAEVLKKYKNKNGI